MCFGFITKHCFAEHVHILVHVGAACGFREGIQRFNFHQLFLQAINPAQESAFDGVGDKGSVGGFSLHASLSDCVIAVPPWGEDWWFAVVWDEKRHVLAPGGGRALYTARLWPIKLQTICLKCFFSVLLCFGSCSESIICYRWMQGKWTHRVDVLIMAALEPLPWCSGRCVKWLLGACAEQES